MICQVLRKIKNHIFWEKLLKNLATVISGNGGASIINFLITILLLHSLGKKEYGMLMIALQYMTLVDAIVNFQSWAGVIKYGSHAKVEENVEKLSEIIKGGFFIDIVTSILGLIIALCILPFVGEVLAWSKEIMILSIIFSCEIIFHIEGTSLGILRLFDKFNYTAIHAVICAFTKLIFIGGYLVLGGKSTIIVCVLYMIANVLKHLSLVVIALYFLEQQIGVKRVLGSSLHNVDKEFFKYTSWNNIVSAVDVPVKYFDIFIISRISVELVAIYKVFKQVLQIFATLINPISIVIMPQFSELIAKNKVKDAYISVNRIRNIVLSGGLVMIGLTVICGKPLLNIFLGNNFGENIFLFQIMLMVQVILLSYVSIHPLLLSLGNAKQNFYIILFSNIVYIASVFIFVSKIGIYAVIMATAIQGGICIGLKIVFIKRYMIHNNLI